MVVSVDFLNEVGFVDVGFLVNNNNIEFNDGMDYDD